jgi:hypothetical protein
MIIGCNNLSQSILISSLSLSLSLSLSIYIPLHIQKFMNRK